MATKVYNPTTPGRRQMSVPSFEEITKKAPEKSLIVELKKNAGRNNTGRITVRHRGGGNKKKYRIIDFKRQNATPATVLAIEYDPNRNPYIALIQHEDGTKAYVIAPVGLKVGDKIMSAHNIEIYPGKGAQLVRTAGSAAQLMAKEGEMAQVRLPSGEVRYIRMDCKATIGQVGNVEAENVKRGKAGKTRYLGIRPTVRGSVMNPVDHPHGGGEGRSPIGRPGPVTPWGKPALGYKTRNKKARTNKFIVKRRNDK